VTDSWPSSRAACPTAVFSAIGKRLLLRIPLGVFHERVLGRQVRDFGARVFPARGWLIHRPPQVLVVQAGKLSETEQYTVAEVTLDLIAAVVHAETDFEASQHGSAQVARMSRILSYLEEHFAEHDLTPARVAEANAVSTRHLHNLFQHSGLSVTAGSGSAA
jgi:hypothetical protein